ncbi:hypothetical protein OHV05_33875 [Kitasatospora sp. NBC_00070]|uniref:hypothetical protein n=1 Tax=Kitasatospora sp. NBC_00070 TaxID=2975962 RepID=UPI00324D8FFC
MTTSTPRSLRELAEAGQLPDHQVMDRPTVDWIAGHRPVDAGVGATLPHWPVLLVPEVSWFARTETATSIHGVLHGGRVAVLLQLLAADQGIAPEWAVAMAAAAACHDCRRRHDRADPGHGERAAHWLTEHPTVPQAAFGSAASPEAITAVALHDVPLHDFTSEQANAYRQHRTAVDLLKAADALDRYRLPLLRWWPDLALLRGQVPAWAPGLAHDLVVRSERALLDGADATEALNHALQLIPATTTD